jgi:hypothetical protein
MSDRIFNALAVFTAVYVCGMLIAVGYALGAAS